MGKVLRVRNALTGQVREVVLEADKCDVEPLEDSAGAPSEGATKGEISDWLAERGVDVPAKVTKAELLALVAGHEDQH